MAEHRVLLVVGPDGEVRGPLGSARDVVLATVREPDVLRWQLHRVDWDLAPDDPHAAIDRVVAFVREHRVGAVVADEIAAPLRDAMTTAGIAVFERGGVSARAAAISAATVLALNGRQ